MNGCADEPAAQTRARGHAVRETPTHGDAIVAHLAQLPTAATERALLVQGGWGAAAGEFGRRPEASRPGPMSLNVDALGRVHVLDQVNQRVQVFSADDGRLLRVVPGVPDTAEDLFATAEDRTWVLAQPSPGQPDRRLVLTELAADGRPLQRGPVHEQISLVTGLFARGDDAAPELWVESRHRDQLRVAVEGRLLAPAAQAQPRNRARGRASRWRPADDHRLLAARLGRDHLTVATLDGARVAAGGALRPLLDLVVDQPLVQILALLDDAAGSLHVAVALERPDDGTPRSFRKLIIVCPPGAVSQARTVELLGAPMASDAFRPIAVAADGTIYQLHTSERGVQIWRWEARR